MSLHDVGKNDPRRDNASINAHDNMLDAAVKAHATDGIAYRTEQNTGVAKAIVKDDQILIYDSSNLRIIIGRLPDGTYGMVVSKEGTDATTLFA